MKKSDWQLLKECFNEKMPENSNRYEKILLIILSLLGSLWIIASIAWGTIGFCISVSLFFITYFLFKVSHYRRTGIKSSLLFNPCVILGFKKYEMNTKK